MEASTGFRHEVTPNWSATVATKRDAGLDFESARPEFAGSLLAGTRRLGGIVGL